MHSHSQGKGPVDLSRTRKSIIQLIWNDQARCCVCDGRTEPALARHRSRMVYRCFDGEEFIYCIPCAAHVFGMDQLKLVNTLNLESVFHDQECAARVQRRTN